MGKLKNENYNVVILAAGIGSRFGKLLINQNVYWKLIINNNSNIDWKFILEGFKRINVVIRI